MSRLLLTALAATVLTSSTAAAKCSFTGLAPLKPVVGDNATPPVPTTPDTPTKPPSPPAPAPPDNSPTKPGDTAGTPTQPPEKPPAAALGFAYHPPGELLPQDAGRGRRGDRFIYLKDIVYPLKLGTDVHPHMNSQIWGHGGNGWGKTKGPGGTECDPPNYDPMLQRDNYCEVRDNDSTHKMPLCPKGYGHQGQDIRPPACQGGKWQAVAVVDGVITRVTGFSYLTLKGKDGTVYGYLHMLPSSVKVKDGDKVRQGQVLGTVSNIMDYQSNGTTYHLHFQVKQQIKVGNKVISAYVPVFSSLIAAYRKEKGLDPGIDKDGNLVVDAAVEIGAAKPEPPKPEPPKPEPPKPEPAPVPEKPAEPQPAPTPAPVPEKPVEPPKPEPPKPAPVPDKPVEPEKPAEPPAPQPAPTPAPAPEKPVEPPKPEPPKPAPVPDKPVEPEKPAEPPAPQPAPTPAPAPEKPVEPPKPEPPKPAPVPDKPVEPEKPAEPPQPAPAPVPAPEKPSEPSTPTPSPAPTPQPEKPADPTAPTPQPAPPVAEPPAPTPQPQPPPEEQSWWRSMTKKVGDWWGYLWGRK